MKEIKLSGGQIAIVDDGDFGTVSNHRWFLSAKKYAATRIDGQAKYMHRVLLNPPSGVEVDHIDGNGLNNQRANLRLCSHKSNVRAMDRTARGLSRFRGVTFDKANNKWMAKITVNGRTLNLGRFKAEIEAANAYRVAATTHFGADYRQEAYDASR